MALRVMASPGRAGRGESWRVMASRCKAGYSFVSRGKTVIKKAQKTPREQSRAPDFVCPNCGGRTFGRETKLGPYGRVIVLDTVVCHDEHHKSCYWRGAWTA